MSWYRFDLDRTRANASHKKTYADSVLPSAVLTAYTIAAQIVTGASKSPDRVRFDVPLTDAIKSQIEERIGYPLVFEVVEA